MDFNSENIVSRRDLIRRGGIVAASVAVVGAFDVSPALGSISASPRRGGNLRIGVPGGPAGSDILDPHAEGVAGFGQAFRQNVYSKLTDMMPDGTFENQLAESMTPNPKATVWKIKLKQGIKFHDGSELTADDVIYTFNRILNPSNVLKQARGNIDMIDPKGIVKDGKYDLTVNLLKPWSDFRAAVGQRYISIIKDGAKGPWTVANANGTGAFKLESWTPGTSYKYVANKNYFEKGKPYVASVTVIGISDSVARVNALLSKQVDAISDAPVNQVPMIRSAGAKIIVNPGGSWTPLVMNTNVAPYNDVRVRQAMRLLVDRQQMIDQALAGYGQVGNDLFNKYDPMYDSALVREQNIEEAKSLLKSAGKSDLTVELATAPYIAGTVEASQVLVQQAKEAGVTVNLKKMDLPAYFEGYGKWPFSGDFFNANEYFIQVGLNQLPTSTYNITHFNDAEYNALYKKGVAELDEAKRKDIADQMQKIEFDRGGNLIWTYATVVDAVAPGVNGFVPDKYGLPLTSYDFARAWMS